MAKTYHRRRHRHANRTRRGGGGKGKGKDNAAKWAESLLSPTSRAYFFGNSGIQKPKVPPPGDTSQPARDRSRLK